MEVPIDYSERKLKRSINKNSTFILIGNNIDGMVDFNFREFDNFKKLSDELLNILSNLKCCGEWDISLYQVKKPYSIREKYGYYKYPSNGKLILRHSYMDCPIRKIIYNANEIIFIGSILHVTENWHKPNEEFHQYDLPLEILKLEIVYS